MDRGLAKTRFAAGISAREAGRRAGVDRRTVCDWLDKGLVKGYRGPHLVRIDPQSLDLFLETLQNSPRASYISAREAGRRAGVCKVTIISWLAKGLVDGYRAEPRVVRIDADSLDRYTKSEPRERPEAGE
jgi:transposase